MDEQRIRMLSEQATAICQILGFDLANIESLDINIADGRVISWSVQRKDTPETSAIFFPNGHPLAGVWAEAFV